MIPAADPYRRVSRRLVYDPYSGGVYAEEKVHALKRESCQLLQTGLDAFLTAGNTMDRAVWAIKHNGWRFMATCAQDGTVTFRTRNDTTYEFPVIASFLKSLAGRFRNSGAWQGREVTFDGELTTADDNPDTLHKAIDGGSEGSDLTYRIFDIVSEDLTLERRLDLLRHAFVHTDTGPNLALVHHAPLKGFAASDVLDLRDRAIAAGREGIVIKNLDAPYIYRRTADWVREVEVITEDLQVLRVERRRAGRVSLICDHHGVEVGVSAGITLERAREFLKHPPVLVEVSHRGRTGAGSLKSAAFKRVRTDKEA